MTIANEVHKDKVTLGNLIASMPATSANTGWRAYEGFAKHGQKVLVMHNNGTPSNNPETRIHHPAAARQYFSWQIEQAVQGLYQEFYSVAKWIEHNI